MCCGPIRSSDKGGGHSLPCKYAVYAELYNCQPKSKIMQQKTQKYIDCWPTCCAEMEFCTLPHFFIHLLHPPPLVSCVVPQYAVWYLQYSLWYPLYPVWYLLHPATFTMVGVWTVFPFVHPKRGEDIPDMRNGSSHPPQHGAPLLSDEQLVKGTQGIKVSVLEQLFNKKCGVVCAL